MVRQAHHDGHPELVEGKKQRWKILMRNLGLILFRFSKQVRRTFLLFHKFTIHCIAVISEVLVR
jgi:hypothetical protein